MNKIFVYFAIALFSIPSFSQITKEEVLTIVATGDEQRLVVENSSLLQAGYLYYAELIANKLITLQPESSNYAYRKGFLALKIRTDYVSAIPYFLKAIESIDPNYDMYSTKEKSSPPDAYFHLATCYHLNEEIDKAKIYYNKFIEVSRPKSELIPVSKLRLIQCENAIAAMGSPVNVQLKNVGKQINGEFPDYSPVISLDGSSLYFTSRRPWDNNETEKYRDPAIYQYPEDIYVSYLGVDSTWERPERLDFCIPRRNEATSAVSTDERRIYLYEDSTGNGDLYFSDFYSNKFNNIEKITQKNINTKYWETHIMVSPDNSKMFFASDRPGGFGGRDIYMCTRSIDGKWSEPVNLGPKINTPYDEDAPFVSIDNRMLYFSSNGEKSIGGFDIMVADLLQDGTWTESRNLGYPFNSTNDDIFYTTTVDGLKGYMTSFRKDGYGEKDIYEIKNDFLGVKPYAFFKGLIKTKDGSPLPEDMALQMDLSCANCDDYNKNKVVFPRLRDGMFMTGLISCKTYTIAYRNASNNTVLYEETFTTKCDVDFEEIYRELILDLENNTLTPVEPVIEIEPVLVTEFKNLEFIHYFDYNKNKLSTKRGQLKDFVKEIEKQLEAGRERITINVYSSASHVPTKTYETNEKLTEIRAENMKYDLIAHFEEDSKYKGKVNVVIVSAIVDGPEYVKDFKKTEKYKPYQFVGLKTE